MLRFGTGPQGRTEMVSQCHCYLRQLIDGIWHHGICHSVGTKYVDADGAEREPFEAYLASKYAWTRSSGICQKRLIFEVME